MYQTAAQTEEVPVQVMEAPVAAPAVLAEGVAGINPLAYLPYSKTTLSFTTKPLMFCPV
ncbi:hypothetical protein D3C87_2134860 [compost metagenome]